MIKKIRFNMYRYVISPMYGKTIYDDTFWDELDFIFQTKKWSIREFKAYQLEQLKETIRYAYENTVYYKRLFDERGWKPEDFKSFKDYSKIPILTKDELKEHLEELRGVSRHSCRTYTTGGSTGKPTVFYLDTLGCMSKNLAYVWNYYASNGYFLGERQACLRGTVIRNGISQIDEKEDIIYFASTKMTEKNISLIINQMEETRVKHICAYPSCAEMLAKYIEKNNILFNKDRRIKTLFTSSETLTDEVRKIVEANLHLRVVDLYGNSEQIGMIGQCKCGKYHEMMTHSYMEYVDENGKHIKNGKGRIIATGLLNKALPVLRYDTGDIAEIEQSSVCKCGNHQKVIKKIHGRWNSKALIIGKSGGKVNIAAINSHADIFGNIYKLQFVQEEPGKIILNIVPTKGYTSKDESKIRNEFKKRLGLEFDLIINECENVECTMRGKSKLLIQKLNV